MSIPHAAQLSQQHQLQPSKTASSFYADLHIHSKYSRACSRDCDLENLTWWARRKGITVVGTGDFTHPAWFDHLRENLVPAEPGLYRLNDELQNRIDQRTPKTCADPVRFMLSVEISTIYKRGDKTRKVHHLVYLPDLEAAARFNRVLGNIGNIASDGRPILGLDSRDLLEITLEASPDGYLIPAHVWTPWFGALGSKSGFDAIADCYVDLADNIFAIETGLSADPGMIWRVSSLDKYTVVSNSDAHSPPMLAREATVFSSALDYYAIREALKRNDGSVSTVEFYPEEGKYHLDGHRACHSRLTPQETKDNQGKCPVCGKNVTVGVLHRVDDLADREPHNRPNRAGRYTSLVPLPEIIGEIEGKGPKTKTVGRQIDNLVAALGPELNILTKAPIPEITKLGGELLGEAITRLREGKVIRESGYDGEYGVIRVFEPGELTKGGLFDIPAPVTKKVSLPKSRREPAAIPAVQGEETATDTGLDPDQQAAVDSKAKQLIIVAGPGTGKTRTLTHRIARLVKNQKVDPNRILAVTFTRRAAEEMHERLVGLIDGAAEEVRVSTFHALALHIIREQYEYLDFTVSPRVADELERLEVLVEILGDEKSARIAAKKRSLKEELIGPYRSKLHELNLLDVDELIELTAALLEQQPTVLEQYQHQFSWIFVDEYQDIDATQYRILRSLTSDDTNLCVIGDPDQSIYGFRGAQVELFLRFTSDYPQAETVTLTRNYRSVSSILQLAETVIRPASLVPEREFVATRQNNILPSLYQAQTESEEASELARLIDELVGGSSFHSLDSKRVSSHQTHNHTLGFGDIAVLYRADAQVKPVMSALDRAGVPYQKRGHDPLVQRRGVAELIHEIRSDYYKNESLMKRLDQATHRLAEGEPAVWQARELLRPLAEHCGDDWERFDTEVLLGAEVDTLDSRADAVSLLTLHAAKGLEFPVVFIVGCDEGTLPFRFSRAKAAAETTDIDEERRLFFVGLTRAQQQLFLSYPSRRARGGLSSKLSTFLTGLHSELLVMRTTLKQEPQLASRQLRLL